MLSVQDNMMEFLVVFMFVSLFKKSVLPVLWDVLKLS